MKVPLVSEDCPLLDNDFEGLWRKDLFILLFQPPVSLVVQQSLTYDSIDGQNFPYKLWFLINNPAFGDVLHWSRDGTAIVFPDDKLFMQKVLKRKEGKIFKTESLKSFVRQLNLYGFRKVMCDRYDALTRSKFGSMFDHEYFLQGRPDLLGKIFVPGALWLDERIDRTLSTAAHQKAYFSLVLSTLGGLANVKYGSVNEKFGFGFLGDFFI